MRLPLRRLEAVERRRHDSVAKRNCNYVYTLTFTAPSGFVFDPALSEHVKDGRKVSDHGTRLIYTVQLKALAK